MNPRFKDLLSLIKTDRLRTSTVGHKGVLIASESDKGRVVNAAAFRRLQQKAQVFPLDKNAAVRTRLTHSIEVSQLGRYIAQKVITNCSGEKIAYEQLAAFVNTVETACLLHDIGNPPFGHLGESAIKEWFKSNYGSLIDLTDFDGNPQGFRLTSFLSGLDDFGLNLTCTLLLSTIKYPWTISTKPPGEEKFGVFTSDYDSYKKCNDALSWPIGKRFPFVQLMEAADDIAYSMSDLEDGIEKKILTLRDIQEEFKDQKFGSGPVEPFVTFKTSIINKAIDAAARSFTDNIDSSLAGEGKRLIESDTEVGTLIKSVKNFARSRVYSSEAAERVELAGRSAISGLLDQFRPLLELPENQFLAILKNDKDALKGLKLDFQIRLARRLPEGYRKKYLKFNRGSNEMLSRAHLIVDFLSGMTDDFALDVYQILTGIKVQ